LSSFDIKIRIYVCLIYSGRLIYRSACMVWRLSICWIACIKPLVSCKPFCITHNVTYTFSLINKIKEEPILLTIINPILYTTNPSPSNYGQLLFKIFNLIHKMSTPIHPRFIYNKTLIDRQEEHMIYFSITSADFHFHLSIVTWQKYVLSISN
jgi:hypothetical protein